MENGFSMMEEKSYNKGFVENLDKNQAEKLNHSDPDLTPPVVNGKTVQTPSLGPLEICEHSHPFAEVLRIASIINMNAKGKLGSKYTRPNLVGMKEQDGTTFEEIASNIVSKEVQKKRGRPAFGKNEGIKRGRGRPRKNASLVHDTKKIAKTKKMVGDGGYVKRSCYYKSVENIRASLKNSGLNSETDENNKLKNWTNNRKYKGDIKSGDISEDETKDDPQYIQPKSPEHFIAEKNLTEQNPLSREEVRQVEYSCRPLTRIIVKRISMENSQ